MSRCLKDQTLLVLYDREGTSTQRAHLTECEACATRYRQLGCDLQAISQVLRRKPPPKAIGHRFRPFTVRWLPTAVAAVLALVLIWEGVRIWNPSARPPHKGITNEEIWSLLEGASADLFWMNQAIAEELWIATDGLAAALQAEWPCEWYDISARAEVESFDGGFGDLSWDALPRCVELTRGVKKH